MEMAQGEWLYQLALRAVENLPDLTAMTPWQWVCAAAGHLSFALSAASYMTTNIVRLRVLSVVALMLGIFFNATLDSGPLWISVMWLVLFLLVNVYRLITGHLAGLEPVLSGDDLALRDKAFPSMRARDWLALKGIASVASYRYREVIPGGDVCVVIEGGVRDAATGRAVGCWGATELLGLEAGLTAVPFVRVGQSDRVRVLRIPAPALRELMRASDCLKSALLEGLLRAANQSMPSDQNKGAGASLAANDGLVLPAHA